MENVHHIATSKDRVGMPFPDEVSLLLTPLCEQSLADYIQGVNLSELSRITASRLKQHAMLSIWRIELVDSVSFSKHYCPLYLDSFHGAERERPEMIADRLADEFAGRRIGLEPYRMVGIRNRHGMGIAAAHASILTIDGHSVVPYLQYIYVRPEYRRKDLSEVLHTLILAVATAHAARSSVTAKVPFTLCETAPAKPKSRSEGHGAAVERSQIHAKSGSTTLMLRRKDGRSLSLHVQPGLEIGDPPLTLVWLVRPNPAIALNFENRLGRGIIQSYYKSLREEGFPERNIVIAERIVESRYNQGGDFCLIPLSEISSDMYVDIDRCLTLPNAGSGLRAAA